MLAFFAFFALACSSAATPTPEPVTPEPVTPEPATPEPTQDDPASADSVALPPADSTAPLGAGETALLRSSLDGVAVELAPRLLAEGDNATFSPASIALAFAMATAGAHGETRSELAHALHLDAGSVGTDPTPSIDAVAHAGRVWGSPHAEYTLAIANRLFAERTMTFDAAYQDLVARRFSAPMEQVDFAGAPQEARTHINHWVASQTQDRIQDLIPPTGIDADTALVLVNAVYFHGAWETAFDRDRTTPEPFTTAAGETIQIATMSRAPSSIRHAERGGAQIVELPYRGDELSMSFVLPPAGEPAHAWITEQHLALLDGIGEGRAELHLPRFRVDPAGSVSLRAALEGLGVRQAWTSDADFTGIASRPGQDPLVLSDAFHKTFVEVNEEGTEAAAATAIVMGRGTGAAPTHAIVRFDRPFLFFLRERATGAILFVGRVGHPR